VSKAQDSPPARILLTGVSGYVGGALLPRLQRDGYELVGLTRNPRGPAAALGIPLLEGDVVSGKGLKRALAGVDVAYYLIHSLEPAASERFEQLERRAARNFARAARRAGVRRVVYLGGPVPAHGQLSAHLRSRLAVEQVLLSECEDVVALRSSIVIGAGSRAFRLLVRLVERMPVVPIPAWGSHRSAPVDERDAVEALARAACSPEVGGRVLDLRGPELVSYRELIERIADALVVSRPLVDLPGINLTPVTSRLAARIAGEQHALVGPLMESLEDDLLPREDDALALLGIRPHPLERAIEHALREWERVEPLRGR
jgi:uncharacterized protein YbjT (DUF2867 family)